MSDLFPVSSAQERLLLADRVDPGGTQYSIVDCVITDAGVDPDRLTEALRQLVRAHESLRTTFTWDNAVALQRVHSWLAPSITRHSPVSESELDVIVLDYLSQPFDLAQGPLVRCLLVPLNDGRWAIALAVHHIVADGWSMRLLLDELSRRYLGAATSSSEQGVQRLEYADYAVWQQAQLGTHQYRLSLAYWTRRLEDAPEHLALPWDRPRPAVQTSDGNTLRFRIDADTTNQVAELARRLRVTPFVVYLAAYQVFLARLAGQDDLVIGLPVANRDRPELSEVVGFFVNTVPIRARIPAELTFADLVAAVDESVRSSEPHHGVPLEDIVAAVAPRRDPRYNPLFQVLFSWNEDPGLRELGGRPVSPRRPALPIAKFDLSLALAADNEGVLATFEFRTQLLSTPTVSWWSKAFLTLLGDLVAAPQQRIGVARLLAGASEREVVALGTGPVIEVPDVAVHRLFEQSARRFPEQTAVWHQRASLTYRDLDERANQLAATLLARGLGPGAWVGICVERSIDMCVAALGVLKAGAAYVPLDPSYPSARLEFMSTDSGCTHVLVSEQTAARLTASPAQLLPVTDLTRTVRDCHGGAEADDPAYLIYTSGSTGTPKGVVVTHRSVTNLAIGQGPVFGLTATDRVLQFASLSFDVSVAEMWLTWAAGATLVLLDEHQRLGASLAEHLRTAEASVLIAPPTALSSLDPAAHPELRLVITTGEPCPPSLVQPWASGRRFVNAYGPTETTVWASTMDLTPDDRPLIGRALPNTRIHVLDSRLRSVPPGVSGEVFIGGTGVARGYHDRPVLTAERFVDSPDGAGRLYRTGDIGKLLADGTIQLAGRCDDQVKLHGFRIELGEIEHVVAMHPAVRRAVACVEYASEPRLVVHIVTDNAEVPSKLRDWLTDRVPAHLVPSAIASLPEVPLTPAGKIDRSALPEIAPERPALGTGYVAPSTQLEEQLAAIWSSVLSVDRVGVYDNFFDLGGNSLLLLRVHEKTVALHPELRITDLFQHPTVAALARGLTDTIRPVTADAGRDRRAAALNRRRGARSWT
ncbi:amino acid adenylation domain-containing protein [Amycolatopsis sulphurea]|uniref:Amino acid adenylation domain-containing protein n=1 Tax=Amycolatopsis sulphurea TaxID=76022 RepID=A0A2A9G0S9_9PSEU|nr:non-ribosomal peptide synthetase [Amycolatopsis sulphurea]PFG57038.1 amino acid adenylation domain-containing protein [Amycolatopsis sulphurea]